MKNVERQHGYDDHGGIQHVEIDLCRNNSTVPSIGELEKQ